jgi:hypothetical protein
MNAFHTIFRFKRILHHASFHTLFRRAELLDVKSRDVVYPVPHEHMGKPIPSREPQALAALGLRFYESLVVEAERFFYD